MTNFLAVEIGLNETENNITHIGYENTIIMKGNS